MPDGMLVRIREEPPEIFLEEYLEEFSKESLKKFLKESFLDLEKENPWKEKVSVGIHRRLSKETFRKTSD